jgi:multidrug resistance efflux pump
MGTKYGAATRPSRRRWARFLGLALAGAVVLLIGLAWSKGAFHLRGQDAAQHQAATLPAKAVLVVGSGEVDVEGGLYPLAPVAQGVVAEVEVADGQTVMQGQPLLRLDADLAAIQVSQAEANLRAAQVRLAQARQGVQDHTLQLKLVEQAIVIAEAQAAAQARKIPPLERLAKDDLTNQAELLSARDQARALQAALAAEKLRKQQLADMDPEQAVRLAQANADAAEQTLAQAKKQLANYTLTAPADGVVLRVLARKGQVWSAAQREPAIWLRPNRPWIVRCEIEQQFAARVADGMPCDIYDDRVDKPLWRGRVQSCSPWIAPRRSFTDDPLLRRDLRTMECIVSVLDNEPPLRVGQRVRVVIREPDEN